jgi:hypothetical protein
MLTRRFQSIVKDVGGKMMAASGFQFRDEGEGFLTFWRTGKPGLIEGVMIYRVPRVKGFTVEIGVVPERQKLGWADVRSLEFPEGGVWEDVGLRERLGLLVHGNRFEGNSLDRDFYRFEDEQSLRAQLHVAFAEALKHGPSAWSHMSNRLRPGS